MIGRQQEYEKMYQLEGRLWWYRSLHRRVIDSIQSRFGARLDLPILDVGCGTGGMLNRLRQLGYTNLGGLDGSTDAVVYCQKRRLPVTLVDLNELDQFASTTQYEVIICNDVFCYFTDSQLIRLLTGLKQRLKPGGIIVSNNNAFAAFGGQHDLAVGVLRRFTRADFDQILPTAGLHIVSATYWSFLLSLPILLVRQWQRLQLTLGWYTSETAQSDVYLPSLWLNELLYQVVKIEQNLWRRTPFGSSLFIVVEGH